MTALACSGELKKAHRLLQHNFATVLTVGVAD